MLLRLTSYLVPLVAVAGENFACIEDNDKEMVRNTLLRLGMWCVFAEQVTRATPNAKIEIVDNGGVR